jgi:hypothetical protein
VTSERAYSVTMATAGAIGVSDDAVDSFVAGECQVIVVADGAGGTGRAGGHAAAWLVAHVRVALAREPACDLVGLLEDADRQLHGKGGETTGLVLRLGAHGVDGASVGDSEAWVVGPGLREVLTAGQVLKPLLGSGRAVARSFDAAPLAGTLVAGSDGLFKYAPASVIARTVRLAQAAELPAQLVELVRLRGGRLADDVAVAVAIRT